VTEVRIFYLHWRLAGPATIAALHFDRTTDPVRAAWAGGLYRQLPDGDDHQVLDDQFSHMVEPIATLERIFRRLNRGSGSENTAYLDGHQLRSLSVGDVVRLGDDYYVCRTAGWERVELPAPATTTTTQPKENP
jgi:hypothetical protein